ncbi:serine/threonine-protein kinase AFC2-like [Hordeum vulgare]|nr:serine/threonine-protein kinase AFC2-like [Hordeum vulgare]
MTTMVLPAHPPDYTCFSLLSKGVARNASPPRREDDKDGHYVFAVGENLTSRYKIYRKMGEGTFGQVLECWDRERKEMVAIKIVRAVNKYSDAAMIEIDVLQKLARNDATGKHCVQIRNWFDYRNHICIVCEKLGPSLYDFLRKNCLPPISNRPSSRAWRATFGICRMCVETVPLQTSYFSYLLCFLLRFYSLLAVLFLCALILLYLTFYCLSIISWTGYFRCSWKNE